MNIKTNTETMVNIVLSESNVEELYHMMRINRIARRHRQASSAMPFLLKGVAPGQRLIVEVELDEVSYPNKEAQ